MNELEEFKLVFFQECDELLVSLESSLEELRDGDPDIEVLHAAFRAIHSIKGGAGAFGLEALVGFAHVFETVLDRMRGGSLPVTADLTALMIRASDVLTDHVNAAKDGHDLAINYGGDVLERLNQLSGATPQAETTLEESLPSNQPTAADDLDDDEDVAFAIRMAPHKTMLARGLEPLVLLRELKELGGLNATVDLSALPDLATLDPEQIYLCWDLRLLGTMSQREIEEVFDFADEDCTVSIKRLDKGKPVDDDHDPASEAPAQSALASCEASDTPAEKAAAQPDDAVTTAEGKAAKDSGNAASSEASGTMGGNKIPTTIRVDLPKIDRLVNMVGELVITQAMLNQQVASLEGDSHAELIQGVEMLARQSREIQESVMAIRALPVKSVFSRMGRLVRELSVSLNKPARLVITGEQTEVDKTVIEELADPLTHMIRNSMDHGLEAPEARVAAGKSREGTIYLSAEHRSGRIVISVGDDGGGINREKVLRRAIEKGLVPPDVNPTVEEIDNMIFLPGFSTADTISNISGRGVGLDVVKRNMQNLGGRINVVSTPGKGSRITLTLPLTLAVLDGMVVRVAGENFIVPINGIVEVLRPSSEELVQLLSGNRALALRNRYIPLVSLSGAFNLEDAGDNNKDRLVVVVDTEDCGRLGIIVDALLGQQQVVIKSLEANYQRVFGVSGATILGNGRVALILDLDMLPRLMQQGHSSEPLPEVA